MFGEIDESPAVSHSGGFFTRIKVSLDQRLNHIPPKSRTELWRQVSERGYDMKELLDQLDRYIILELQEDARRSFKKIARKLGVSDGTVRTRINRLIAKDILELQARVNPFSLHYKIPAVVGVNLSKRFEREKMKEIEQIPCVTSVWITTGRYDLFFEVMVDSLSELNDLFAEKPFGGVEGVASAETFVVLSSNTKYFKLSGEKSKKDPDTRDA